VKTSNPTSSGLTVVELETFTFICIIRWNLQLSQYPRWKETSSNKLISCSKWINIYGINTPVYQEPPFRIQGKWKRVNP
jgi:hypothetical protein